MCDLGPTRDMPPSTHEERSPRRPWLRGVWRVARGGLLVYLLVILLLMIFEQAIIYPAPRYPQGDWRPEGLQFEDVQFVSEDDTRLHGWYFPHERPRSYLLYCHGNGDFVPNLGHYADMLRGRYQLSILIFDYRGYGRSAGKPNEQGVLSDARAARAWLARKGGIPEQDIILLGRSLGGAVAVNLAVRSGARALILENTFTSMPDVGAYHYPWLPVRLMMRTQFNSLASIASYRGPLLQSHGDADEIVPIELGKRLFDAAVGEKEFITCAGNRHNDPMPISYYEALDKFLARVLP